MLRVNLYQSQGTRSKNFGKYLGYVSNNEPIGLEGLAAHIASHGSPYTEDVILGVSKAMVNCIRELALSGQPVKLPDLCIVSAAIQSKAVNDVLDYKLSTDEEDGSIKSAKLTFRATGKARKRKVTEDATFDYTTLAKSMRKAAQNAQGGGGSGSGSTGSGDNTGGDGGDGDDPVENRP